ncbi:MAG: dUTP diphosphatase [Microbacteriaceae bacterium]|nr:dUTP diphosphatase [Microbacteriaceae bacterium]
MSNSPEVLFVGKEAPKYALPGDAGADLKCTEAFTLAPGERKLIGTGLHIALPDGYLAFVVPRSGLAIKHGISIVNSPGTIDAGYRGEIMVPLWNTDTANSFSAEVGDRIAQLIILPVQQAAFVQVQKLPDSDRGTGGFGSTGVKPN